MKEAPPSRCPGCRPLALSRRLSALVRLMLAAVLAALSTCHPGPQEASFRAERIELSPGAVFARTLAPDSPYRFAFELPAGYLLRLGVEQQGVDVVVYLHDPSGRLLYEVDSPTGAEGVETVEAVTPAAGEHRLTVEPYREAAAGGFVLRVEALYPAQEADRTRAAGAAALAGAQRRRAEGDFEGAAAAYRRALPHLQAEGQTQEAARATWRLGECLLETGELREAALTLERAAAAFRERDDPVGEARALIDLGAARRVLGELEAAANAYRRALELYRRSGIANGEASALNNLGLVLEGQGNLESAALHYEEALDIWRRLERPAAEAATLENLGNLYLLIGLDEEALDLLERAVALLAAAGKEAERASAFISLGWAHYLAGRPEVALEHYRTARRLAREAGEELTEAGARDRQGTALRALGRYAEAADAYTGALSVFRAAGSRLNEGHTLANLGWLEIETGQLSAGRDHLHRAVELLVESGDPNGEVYARVGLARLERRLGHLATAREELDVATRLVETVRGEVAGAMARSTFLAVRYDAFEELVSLLMELDGEEPERGHAREALEVAERARSRSLLDAVVADASGSEEGGRRLARRRELLAEIRALDERRLRLARADDDAAAAIQRTERLLRQRRLELDRLTDSGTSRARVTPPLTAEQIQELAEPGTLLIYYLLAEPQSFAWTVDQNGIKPHQLPSREEIEERARRVAELLPHSQELVLPRHLTRTLEHLSAAVLGPLAERLTDARRVVVLADGPLHHIPFGVLPSPSAAGDEPGAPLLSRHEIVVLPSATVLAQLRRRRSTAPRGQKTVAVLADPVFSAEDERLGGRPGRAPAGSTALARAMSYLDLAQLGRLPHTAREAAAILALVPPGQRLGAQGFDASKDLVVGGALRPFRILHFATHGLVHPVLPELSGVVLSLYDKAGHPREGFLRAPEVAELDLPAELAVLSACRTGVGREIRGEGLVGLTQAFFQAGAQRVVVSHWNVSDEATAALMARLYRAFLLEGQRPSAALRAAQLAVRATPGWEAPYYWGAFTLHGEWQ